MVNRLKNTGFEIQLDRTDKHIDPLLFRRGDTITIKKRREMVICSSEECLATIRKFGLVIEYRDYLVKGEGDKDGSVDLSSPKLTEYRKSDELYDKFNRELSVRQEKSK
ncbi:MAG: hypothetical protein ABIH37_04150 [archaeon]